MAEFELPPTETLRRNALTRSQLRNAQVARRRIAWRWTLWILLQLLCWVLLPALLAAGAWWAFWREPPAEASGPLPVRPASNPSVAPALPAHGLQLRLDEEAARRPGSGSGSASQPQAQSGATPNVDDRSSRER